MKNKKLFAILTLVCFMFTLMPVAAFANPADAETSVFEAVDGDQTVRLKGTKTDAVDFELELFDNTGDVEATTGVAYVWAENAAGNVSSAMEVVAGTGYTVKAASVANVYEVTPADASKVTTVKVEFVRAGEYTVKAALLTGKDAADMDSYTEFDGAPFSVITVKGTNVDPDGYVAKVEYTDAQNNITMTTPVEEGDFAYVTYASTEIKDKDGNVTGYEIDATTTPLTLSVTPNNVFTDDITVTFYESMTVAENATADLTVGKALKNEKVTIETNSAAIEVDKETATTNNQGKIKFAVSASIEGDYEVILTVDGVEWVLNVKVGHTGAAYIETENAPKAPQALYSDLGEKVRFTITDINGNVVKTTPAPSGMAGVVTTGNAEGKYIVLTEKPADSDLESEDLILVAGTSNPDEWYLADVNNGKIYLDAEGTYAVKVILDNGHYATAEWTVEKFNKPVSMYFSAGAPAQAELGRTLTPEVTFVDANGVEKVAKASEYTLAAAGYAIFSFDGKTLVLKSDEKYVGSEVTLTAVSEKYSLSCTKTITVTEAAGIAFTYDSLEVNVNNTVEWYIVDVNGKAVKLNNTDVVDPTFLVIDKPEGAKVSVSGNWNVKDEGTMKVTSDTVGNVTIQVLAQVNIAGPNGDVVKYLTGTVVLPIGTDATGDVVVMSIGSSYIVVNDEIKEIPAPAMIKEARTFVPFRAIGEAFGAEVAWDAATQSVTAEMNGVTVVLTIGSNTYTVNGVEKVADVAPFIAGDGYTMVPARLIAEAFGAEVLFTKDANGATADVLFLM